MGVWLQLERLDHWNQAIEHVAQLCSQETGKEKKKTKSHTTERLFFISYTQLQFYQISFLLRYWLLICWHRIFLMSSALHFPCFLVLIIYSSSINRIDQGLSLFLSEYLSRDLFHFVSVFFPYPDGTRFYIQRDLYSVHEPRPSEEQVLHLKWIWTVTSLVFWCITAKFVLV